MLVFHADWIRSVGDQDEGTSVPMQELGRQIQASGLAGRMQGVRF